MPIKGNVLMLPDLVTEGIVSQREQTFIAFGGPHRAAEENAAWSHIEVCHTILGGDRTEIRSPARYAVDVPTH